MTYYNAPVLLSLFIFILPFYQSFEVIFGFLVINYLVVPVPYGEYRKAFSTESIQAAMPNDFRENCFAGGQKYLDACTVYWKVIYMNPLLLAVSIGVGMIVVSFMMDKTYRHFFCTKKIVATLARHREQSLTEQKESQTRLIQSIFPPGKLHHLSLPLSLQDRKSHNHICTPLTIVLDKLTRT